MDVRSISYSPRSVGRQLRRAMANYGFISGRQDCRSAIREQHGAERRVLL
jgi:hypothetical protein